MKREDAPVLPGEILNALHDLGTSLINHSNWLKVLHRTLISDSDPNEEDFSPEAHHKCLFGHWYDHVTDPALKGLPHFEEVGELHQQVHSRARHLLQLNRKKERISAEEYDAFIDIAHRFRVAVQSLQFAMVSQVCAVDHLTGVWNRYAMLYKLSHELERSRRSNTPCAVALLDFDHFKTINDTHGHVAGDMVLKTTLRFISAQMRKYDEIFRYGGEEFLFMFPDTDLEMATRILERLRQQIRALPILLDNGAQINVSVSIGLSLMDGDHNEQDAIACADNALLSAKMNGRDRIHVW